MRWLPLYPEPPRIALDDATAKDLDSDCRDCRLGSSERESCIPAELLPAHGEEKERVQVFAGPPTLAEAKSRRPMSAQTGQWVRRHLEAYRRQGVSFLLEHAVKCPGQPTPKVYPTCAQYARATYDEFSPDRILVLGAAALNTVVGLGGAMESMRGGYAYSLAGIPVFFMLDPLSPQRNRLYAKAWVEDLERAMGERPALPPITGEYALVETPEDAQEAAESIRLANVAAYDAETFGGVGDPHTRVMAFAVSLDDGGETYVWEHEAMADPECVAPLLDALTDPLGPVFTGWNVKFDQNQLLATPANTRRLLPRADIDAMLLRKIAHANILGRLEAAQPLVGMAGKDEVKPIVAKGATALASAAHLDKPLSWPGISDEAMEFAKDRVRDGVDPRRFAYAAIPPDVRARYVALDASSTVRLLPLIEAEVESTGTGRVWPEIGHDLAHAICAMERNGIRIDPDRVRLLQKQCEDEIEQLQAELDKIAQKMPDGEFNPNASGQIATYFYEVLGLPVKRTTRTGRPSADADTLSKLTSHPRAGKAAQAILSYRRAVKFKSTYADALLREVRGDGRVHPSFRIDGTESGRPSCAEPNLLNIPSPYHDDPQKAALGKMCRELFVAEPGWMMIEGDYSQIEIRVAASLSQDPVMMEVYSRTGVDFHLETARLIAPAFGTDPATVTKDHPLRARAKTVNFAILYGDSPYGLGLKLGISTAEAEALISAIFGAYRGLAQWVRKQVQIGRRSGETWTAWKGSPFRRRPLYAIADVDEDARKTAERSTYNTPCQGTAADYTNRSLGDYQRWIEDNRLENDVRLVLTVYDAILVEAREDIAPLAAKNLRRIMQSHDLPGVPLIVDVKLGESWGEMRELEE